MIHDPHQITGYTGQTMIVHESNNSGHEVSAGLGGSDKCTEQDSDVRQLTTPQSKMHSVQVKASASLVSSETLGSGESK